MQYVVCLLHVHNGLTPAQLGLCSFPCCAPPTHLPTVGHGQGPDEKSVHGGCKLSSGKRGLYVLLAAASGGGSHRERVSTEYVCGCTTSISKTEWEFEGV